MSNREALSASKPFKKRAHRPWNSDLLENTIMPHTEAPSESKSAPIVTQSPKTASETSPEEKGRLLIGGFFKPEGLRPDYLESLPPDVLEAPVTSLANQANALAAVWENNNISSKENFSEVTAVKATTQTAIVDLNNTEALLETIIKAKQQEVEQLSQQAFSRVKQMETRLKHLENERIDAETQRLSAEEKLSHIILQIQQYENARNEEYQKRKAVEVKILEVKNESENIKKQAAVSIEKAQLQANMQEEARIAAEKLTEESLTKLAEYVDIIKAAETLSEKYAEQTKILEDERHETEARLEKMSRDMEGVYQLKVTEKLQKLEESKQNVNE